LSAQEILRPPEQRRRGIMASKVIIKVLDVASGSIR